MPKKFVKQVGPMTEEKLKELQNYLGDEHVLEYDGDKRKHATKKTRP